MGGSQMTLVPLRARTDAHWQAQRRRRNGRGRFGLKRGLSHFGPWRYIEIKKTKMSVLPFIAGMSFAVVFFAVF